MDSSGAFNALYEACVEICETSSINVPENTGKKRRQNCTTSSTKETFQNSFDKIIDIFVREIQERFKASNLEPVLELFNVIMLDDQNKTINFEILKVYENLINMDDLKLELQSYIKYKELNKQITWIDFDILIKEFIQKDLKVPFKQIFLVIKLYLTIPVTTSEGERCFSVLKLIKSCLRTTMTNDRLSDLSILKIANDVSINYEHIIDDFANLRNRQLAFF